MACLRKAPLSAIAPAQDTDLSACFAFWCCPPLTLLSSGIPFKVFHPAFDGKTITIRPTPSLLQGIHSRVPLIVGCATFLNSMRIPLKQFSLDPHPTKVWTLRPNSRPLSQTSSRSSLMKTLPGSSPSIQRHHSRHCSSRLTLHWAIRS